MSVGRFLDPNDDEVQRVFAEFWADIVMPNGNLDLLQVKRELYDYRQLLSAVPLVYDSVTGGRLSKPNTAPDAVIAEADDYRSRCEKEAVREYLRDLGRAFREVGT